MKSVLTTRKEIYERFQVLHQDYRNSFDQIAGLAEVIGGYVDSIDDLLAKGEAFENKDAKELLGDLNAHQTNLVNTLRRMNELHAKMGYLVN